MHAVQTIAVWRKRFRNATMLGGNGSRIRWRRLDLACGVLSLSMGLFAGYFDFVGQIEFGEDVWPALFLLPLFSVFVGFARPVKAWRWPGLMCLSVFVAHIVGTAILGSKPADPPHPSPFAPLISLIPGLVGVYLGVLMSVVADQLRKDDDPDEN
jgi:hypothetical protein